ncbi:MAG: ferrous iron transport protein A [Rhodospirillales bacterium]|nr:ferrous iron transport protein A [Rhodospirillales bacterium]MDH3790850.1 ferrous iron transport protein A [Rhodospirillales bacterium]MDH3912968.1 ferrous iron transport protein A [Rhodospirillales bacterium]MDH3917636.1 ferrous iron transport protein A [Rhodospirillales bacterium]MDH3967469.1 ferrous iron transport protein A [Rhodospirillales bacterium]
MSPDGGHLRSFPLALAAKGERLLVAALQAERRLIKRLGDLGLRRGAEIQVVHHRGDGSLVVLRHNARLALGAQTAAKILVTPVEAPALGAVPAPGD